MARTNNLRLNKWDNDTDGLNRMQFTENFEVIDERVSSLYGATNMRLKTASVTIANSGTQKYDNLPWFGKVFDRLKIQGLGTTLVTMHNMSIADGVTFQRHTDAQIQAVINAAKARGVNIRMMKPHVVTEWSDGFNRSQMTPSNLDTWFTNWTNELLFVANIANRNGIEWLSIAVEHYGQTTPNRNYGRWSTLISAIRTAYPKLKLTIACTGQEINETVQSLRTDPTNLSVMHLVDAIGANIYGSYYWAYYDEPGGKPNITVKDVARGLYLTQDGYSVIQLIFQNCWATFGKPMIVTEFGCANRRGGLIKPIMTDSEINYNVQALLFQAFFDNIMTLPYVQGFAIWHVHSPFQYFDYDGLTITAGERLIMDYTARGLI